jgi:hypothetical protein
MPGKYGLYLRKGGNKLRGLYNICLKSLGAAMKRNPDVRLDYCIEYAELMLQPGFYFMDRWVMCYFICCLWRMCQEKKMPFL